MTPMIPQTFVVFASPVTLRLSLPANPRQRVTGEPAPPVERSFARLPLLVQIDPIHRQIRASLSPLPGQLELYASTDFSAACADSMDDHAARVLQLLGSTPSPTLQALIDGTELPEPPPRVPREIANWRAKTVLATTGKLSLVDGLIEGMDEPQASVLRLAWNGNAALQRTSQTVVSIGQALGMSAADLDAFFIAADAISL